VIPLTGFGGRAVKKKENQQKRISGIQFFLGHQKK